MTAQTLINAVSQSIDSAFGECEIYEDEPEQGLNEPCFLIVLIESSSKWVMGNRYEAFHSFDIHYFPKENKAGKMYQVADALCSLLEYIKTEEGMIRGENLRSKIQDGVLHFFVDYKFFTMKHVEREGFMEYLDAQISKKG